MGLWSCVCVFLFAIFSRALAYQEPVSFCSLSGFEWEMSAGKGNFSLSQDSKGCDVVTMWSLQTSDLAASFRSPAFQVTPGQQYRIDCTVTTDNLIPSAINGGFLTGGPYVHFFDENRDSSAWFPQYGTLAPSTATNISRALVFDTPTTAHTAQIHLAFSAHTTAYDPNRMTGGRATGRVMFSNIILTPIGTPVVPLPPTMVLGDEKLDRALNQTFSCLHNAQLSGNFTVGAGYTISDNISPDLTFGLLGVRRTAHDAYLNTYIRQWATHQPDGASGLYTAGRVMGQIYWPLGIDNIFSYTGNVSYLAWAMPLVDASLKYTHTHSDELGLATLIPKGKGRMGGGADWVDWYTTRLDGRTFQFHLWYAYVLERFANLHTEFASESFASSDTAATYRERAAKIRQSLLQHYLNGTHWCTNIDYPDEGEWMDDTAWSIYHDLYPSQLVEPFWNRLDSNRTFYEGVPMRWGAFPTNHWDCSWLGRLGGGDILARFGSQDRGSHSKALSLLYSVSDTLHESNNIYEGYTMQGCGLASCGCTTSGFGDYLEHCGAMVWMHLEGLFGVRFESEGDTGVLFSVSPRFTQHTSTSPTANVVVRGSRIQLTWDGVARKVTVTVSKFATEWFKGTLNVRVGCDGQVGEIHELSGDQPTVIVPCP